PAFATIKVMKRVGGFGRSFIFTTIAALAIASVFFVHVASAQTASYTRNLTVGDSGSDVSSLQSFLIQGGFLHVAASTGYFGSLTSSALAAWQASVGLPSTGFFGPLSRSKIGTGQTSSGPTSNDVFTTNLTIGDSGSEVIA